MTAHLLATGYAAKPMPLFARLFDDAATFPPGSAPMDEAVARHLEWRASPRAPYVGPFICSSTRWDELVACLPAAASITVSLTVPGGPADVAAALERAASTQRVTVTSVEVALVDAQSVGEAVELLDAALPWWVRGYLELPPGSVDATACQVLAGSPLHLKLRTGGATAAAFPTETALATAIRHAVHHRLPFKLTAGLHHAVRHLGPEGFEHHGFLNVIWATATALSGGPASSVAAALAARGSADILQAVRTLSPQTAHAVRRQFESFGTCSIDDPLEDLTTLGLLEEPPS